MQLKNNLNLQEINQLKKELLPKPTQHILVDRFNPKSNNSAHAAACSGQCRTGSCMGLM